MVGVASQELVYDQTQVVRHPGLQTIRNGVDVSCQGILHLPYSEFVEIREHFRSVFRHGSLTLLDRRAVPSSILYNHTRKDCANDVYHMKLRYAGSVS